VIHFHTKFGMSSCNGGLRLRAAAIFLLYIVQTIRSMNLARLLLYVTAHFTIRYRFLRMSCRYERYLLSFMAGSTKVLRRGELSVKSLTKLLYASKDTDGKEPQTATRTISQSCIIQQRTREAEIKTTSYCLHVVNRTQIKN